MNDIKYEVVGTEYTSDHEDFEPVNPLNRPEIKYKKVIISVVLFILVLMVTYVITKFCADKLNAENSSMCAVVLTAVAGLTYMIIISKKAVIWCVKVYQHYAPEHVRLRCVFEPSCSEYMIMAVEKYGTFIGVTKGIKRLDRKSVV